MLKVFLFALTFAVAIATPPVLTSSSAAEHAACNAYCTTIMTNCPAPYNQYNSMLNCTNYCYEVIIVEAETLDYPSKVPSGGDSFACRKYHSGLAAAPSNRGTHCPHAGPSGGSVCGNYCQAYCNAMMGLCGAIGQTTDGYSSSYANCLSLCAAIPVTSDVFNSSGVPATDDIMCRLYHGATNGLVLPVPHCSHASLSGGSVCGSYCSVYCRMLPQYCPNAIPSTLSGGACNTWCNSYYNNTKIGSVGDTTGDTINCRIHWLIQANVSSPTAAALACQSAIGAPNSQCPLPIPPPPASSGSSPTTPKGPPASSGSAPPTSGSAPPTSGSSSPPPGSSNATSLFVSLVVVVAAIAVALF